jgi:hypothetical protein
VAFSRRCLATAKFGSPRSGTTNTCNAA